MGRIVTHIESGLMVRRGSWKGAHCYIAMVLLSHSRYTGFLFVWLCPTETSSSAIGDLHSVTRSKLGVQQIYIFISAVYTKLWVLYLYILRIKMKLWLRKFQCLFKCNSRMDRPICTKHSMLFSREWKWRKRSEHREKVPWHPFSFREVKVSLKLSTIAR
jgi:hypothetical protein